MQIINSEMLAIIGPAIAAGLMVALIHAPLGIEVLKRGIIFIDLAIAQFAGLGLVAASVLWDNNSLWIIQFSALAAALAAAGFFRTVEKYLPNEQEAIIGCSFVLAASLSLLLLADQPHGGEEIQHLLSGQILFVTWKDILLHAPVYMGILAIWFIWPLRAKSSALFYILFAVAITSSVQLVGVYVVFASLILPALAAAKSSNSYKTAWTCGALSVISGILLSMITDAPSGPAIVICYMVIAVMMRIFKLKHLVSR